MGHRGESVESKTKKNPIGRYAFRKRKRGRKQKEKKEREWERRRKVIQPCRGITGRVISPSYGRGEGGRRKFLRGFYVVYARLDHRIIRRAGGGGGEQKEKTGERATSRRSVLRARCGARSLKQIKE